MTQEDIDKMEKAGWTTSGTLIQGDISFKKGNRVVWRIVGNFTGGEGWNTAEYIDDMLTNHIYHPNRMHEKSDYKNLIPTIDEVLAKYQ